MQNIKYLMLITVILALAGCKKDFLSRLPQTDITEEVFFRTPSDLEIYTNGFYGMMLPKYDDTFSDNISIYTAASPVDNMLRGGITPSNVTGWDAWGNIRRINFMLDHLNQTVGDANAIKHFTGIARFFRAYVYYEQVKKYGDLPWYGHVIKDTDKQQLQKPKDPRTLVVDSIMADLEYAVANVKADVVANNSRLTKWAALALLSRIALHEGTFRKYHDELGLQSTADKFLERAASASQQIMDNVTTNGLKIYNTGNPATDFRTLFSSGSLAGNPEIIFVDKSDKGLAIANNSHTVLDYQWALNAELINDFLMKDGTRFTDIVDYDKKGFVDVFIGRDPRLAETAMPPGYSNSGTASPYIPKPSLGGYSQIKFYPRDAALRGGWVLNYTDLPLMRYAEVLLNYAEAKAELGTITQIDADKTIGLLRLRAGLPILNVAGANSNIDPLQALHYKNVNGTNTGVILEIRRERRVELACEGFRYDDLMRWKAGKLLAEPSKGIYFSSLGAIDVTGDGKPDLAILENSKALDPISNLPADQQAKLAKYYLTDGTFYLSNGTSGNIMFIKDRDQKREFIEPKYYYFPIPVQETVLNPNLKQPFGW